MNKLEALGCVEVTSQIQAKNGTTCYYDPITGCKYLSYKSGYIRRHYKAVAWYGHVVDNMYQLNPTKMVPYVSFGETRHSKIRIKVYDAEDQMDLLARAVANFRKNSKNRKIVKFYDQYQ